MKMICGLIVYILFAGACTRYGGGTAMTSEEGTGTRRDNVVPDKLAPSQYVSWIEDKNNGMEKEKKIDDIVFSVQYRPVPYVICEEEKKNEISDSLAKRRSAELSGMQYMNLKIEVPQGELLKYGLTKNAQYEDRVNYFSFGMQKDIQLVEAGDTLPCLLFHYERVYDIAPYGVFLLAFPKGKDAEGDKTLIFSDNEFNKGIIKFHFEGKDIKKLPQLETI